MQKKHNRLFLFLRLAPLSWQTHQASKLLLASKKVDLLPHLRKEIHFLSRFLSVLVDLVKLYYALSFSTACFNKGDGLQI